MLPSYEWVEENGSRGKGKKELLRIMNGEALSLNQMIMANCYVCMGYYIDGAIDCSIKDCPLYSRMPYREGGVSKLRKAEKKPNPNLKRRS